MKMNPICQGSFSLCDFSASYTTFNIPDRHGLIILNYSYVDLSELPHISIRWIVEEYFMNPFVVWGFSLLTLELLSDHVTPVAQFLELLWSKELYLTFLFPMFIIYTSMTFLPYRSGLRVLVRNRQTVFSIVLLIIPLTIFVMIEPELAVLKTIILMGSQKQEIIKDQEQFTFDENIIFFMTFIFIPGSHINAKRNLITTLRNHRILTRDTIDTEKLIPIIWMTFIFLLISFVVSNQVIK